MSLPELTRLRERLDMSQEDISRCFGVAGRSVIYFWESGRRKPLETIRRLVAYLNALPVKEAREFLEKLESYGKKRK